MEVDRDKFAELVGSSFVLKGADDRTVEVDLVEVSEMNERPHQRTFSIVFVAPESCAFEQGIYHLEREGSEPLQLFLVPIGMKDGRMLLEAVFNFLAEKIDANA